MLKPEIDKAVDSAFDCALDKMHKFMERELYPSAFANEYSHLRVKAVFNMQNAVICEAVKTALSEILSE